MILNACTNILFPGSDSHKEILNYIKSGFKPAFSNGNIPYVMPLLNGKAVIKVWLNGIDIAECRLLYT